MEITITWRFTVGIDIAKETLALYLFDRKTGRGVHHELPNDQDGFSQLRQWLAAQQVVKSQTVFCSEHTGRYGEHLLRWSTTNNWTHAVVKTTALKKVGYDHHRKTDEWDAQGLAEYGIRFADRLHLSEAPTPAVTQLKRFRAERRKMVDQRAGLKAKRTEAPYHDANMDSLTDMWTQQIELLDDHIQQVEQQITTLIEETPSLSQRYQLLRSAPGMGPVWGQLWLSLFAGQSKLNPRKISSRFGFAPHQYSSGSSVKKSTQSTGFGNASMRKVAYQAARSVATHHPHYRDYYQRKTAEGKPERLVINNIINKLIRLYCAMWNNQAEYDPNYIQKMKEQWKKPA